MYNVVATTGSSDNILPDQLENLLKNLLAERFQLRVHWEIRQASIYALILAQNGPKFKESPAAQKPGINTQKGPGTLQMKAIREPMSILASNLGNQMGRIVLDQTGLKGMYDWSLSWDPEPNADSTNPSIFTALQQQLGLKLDPQRGPSKPW